MSKKLTLEQDFVNYLIGTEKIAVEAIKQQQGRNFITVRA